MIRLVVFDMAGTTVDDAFSVHDAMIRAFAQFEMNIDRKIASQAIAVPKPVGIHQILSAMGKDSLALEKQLFIAFKKHMSDFYANSPKVREVPGASHLFRNLRDLGIKIGLDTGFDRELADIILRRMSWSTEGLIDATITSDEVEHGRPYPDMIYRLMNLCAVDSTEEVIKVGDTPTDMIQGKNAGCIYTIGRNSGAFSTEELLLAGADLVIEDLSRMLTALPQFY